MIQKHEHFSGLALSDCLDAQFRRVLDLERPPKELASIYAVFQESVKDGPFCGLALPEDIALHPDWIFADLVEHRPSHGISIATPIKQALAAMEEHAVYALPVLDLEGEFYGVVTRSSILLQMFNREASLLQETKRLYRQVDHDRKQLAGWSARLSDLLEASRSLLYVLAHTSLETDLLQQGINALTKLLQAKYGAIGILDEDGGLRHFHHTGIGPEQVKEIGQFPEGKGLLGAVIKEDHAIRLDDLSQDPRSAGFPKGHPPMKSLLAVPISHVGHVYGRIYLCDRLDGLPFTGDDELLAMSFAHSLSLVLENAREIDAMKKAQQRLDYLAHFDTLTGLPNRELLTDRIRQTIAQSKRHGRKMALMFIDVDNFKAINDAFGHGVGDGLLKKIANVISMAIREGDTAARIGGDEFVVVLPEINQAEDAAIVAEKIVNAIKDPVKLENMKREIFVTASIGIGIFPQDGNEMEKLISAADTAMYQSKFAGKNTFRFFTSDLNKKLQLHLEIEQHLRQAISRKELMLQYQPQIDLANGMIKGVEALLRWKNPELGQVPPAEFIPVAEETGLIIPIGAWVIRAACKQMSEWYRAGYPIHVSVNVSARQIQHDRHFMQTIQAILKETALPARLLELEITESLMMQEADTALEILEALKQLGIRFSMDDFGTGYSSLSYLKRLPLDVVKIDKSFIRDIATDRNDAAIVAAITAMAFQLELEVIAEGVETAEQLEFIKTHQCHTVQGYYFSKPVGAEEITSMLQRQSPVFPGEYDA